MRSINVLRHLSQFGIGLIAFLALFLAGCGGGGNSNGSLANADKTTVSTISAGATPFIASIDLDAIDISKINRIGFTIQPKAGTISKAVSVSFSEAYLTREGYSNPGSQTISLPIFGLYAGYTNPVDITLDFTDGSKRKLPTAAVTTSAYTGGSTVYTTPVVHIARNSTDNLGFSFFYMKNGIDTPVIVDTDGNVRWLGPSPVFSFSSAWYQNGFVVGATGSAITRYELDGRISSSNLSNPNYLNFHHNIDLGPAGLLGEFDQTSKFESTLAEFDSTSGTVLKEWDMAQIISDYMTANGDDPSLFVIPGIDWFHNNASTYDARDNSLIVSSRENFLIKIDYATGQIIWIFGDPSKYWYTFPSLQAKALTLASGGLYPIGQHAVSITPQGNLQVFNNGLQSLNQPSLQGDWRSYSTVSTYFIDEVNYVATDISEFDNTKSLLSNICSSAYTEADGSMLVDYAASAPGSATPAPAPNPLSIGTSARLVGLNPAKSVVFDFEYPMTSCNTDFNANVVRLESLIFN
jgi:arylsulfate sulfotransferase